VDFVTYPILRAGIRYVLTSVSDPDPHSAKMLDPDPDPHKTDADPKHWF
jgi:hypothetical protein